MKTFNKNITVRGEFVIKNCGFVATDMCDEKSTEGIVVYEVLRIADGVPLFFDDHFQRLINSCELINKTIGIDKKMLLEQFVELGKKNSISHGNIMLKFIFNIKGCTQFIFFIPHSYPSEEDYLNGVSVGFLEAERENPEAKVEQGVRDIANKVLEVNKIAEVLLVDHDGYITEGSRSNVVFVKGDALYTCNMSRILKGITLDKVLGIASAENIPVVFKPVHQTDISSYDALFITGTSPKILPVAIAGNTHFDTGNHLVRRLMNLYDELMEEEVKRAKNRLNTK